MSRGDKTVIYEDSRGQWRWRRVARNGEIIAVGEGHARRSDAERSASRAFLSPDTPDHPDDAEAPAGTGASHPDAEAAGGMEES